MALIDIRSCSPGISLFRLVDELWKETKSNSPLHRICTVMRWMQVNSVVIEDVDKAYPEYKHLYVEVEAIRRRLQCTVEARFDKLTFLRTKLGGHDTLPSKVEMVMTAENADFLGYAVIVSILIQGRIAKNYIFEAVIRDFSPAEAATANGVLPEKFPSHYLHVKKVFMCRTLRVDREYTILGTFFCQQNSITNVCAHACALMMLNNCKELTTPITFEDINNIIGLDHEGTALIVDGCYANNDQARLEGVDNNVLVDHVFPHFGFEAQKFNGSAFRDFLYGYVESGYPALLTFSTTKSPHVVAIVGHTWNPHSWFPSAFPEYTAKMGPKGHLSSLMWINDFVVHDDNFGMQLTLPAHCFGRDFQADMPQGTEATPAAFRPLEAIGIFPSSKSVRLQARAAESHALVMLRYAFRMFGNSALPVDNYYVGRLRDVAFAIFPTIVLRTSLVNRSAYLASLRKADNCGDHYDTASLDAIALKLKNYEHFWLVEATEPDLYVGNLSKVVDIIMDASFDPGPPGNPSDVKRALIMVRFPEFILSVKEFKSKDEIAFQPPTMIGAVKGHMSLLLQ
jgi:hypothetical protein